MCVGTMPRLLRDIVHASVEGKSDIELVGEASAAEDLPALLGTCDPHVLVIGHPAADEAELWPDLLYRHPRLRILAVKQESGRARLYYLRPEALTFLEISMELLLQTIRDAAEPPFREILN